MAPTPPFPPPPSAATPQAATSPALPGKSTLAPITLADGTLEALKWLGIVLMTLDHVNKYLLAGQVPWLFALGRVAMPLFGFVLAYNRARPGMLANGAYRRTRNRLLRYGAVATIPFIALKAPLAYGGWPLNVLFTLWVGTLVIELLKRRQPKLMLVILPLFAFGSLLPEYWHLGTGTVVAAWYWCKHPRVSSLVLWMLPRAGDHQSKLLRLAGDSAGSCRAIRRFARTALSVRVLPLLSCPPLHPLADTGVNCLIEPSLFPWGIRRTCVCFTSLCRRPPDAMALHGHVSARTAAKVAAVCVL